MNIVPTKFSCKFNCAFMYYTYFDRIFTVEKCEALPVAPAYNEPEDTAAKTTVAARSDSLQEPVKADNSQPGGKFSKIAVIV